MASTKVRHTEALCVGWGLEVVMVINEGLRNTADQLRG